MIKSVLSSSYDFGEQSTHIIGVTGKGLDSEHLRKSASSSVTLFNDVDIKPEKGKTVIHIVAMGAAPFYPSNKNGDIFFDDKREVTFPEGGTEQLKRGLKDSHTTFETNANVFKEHKNNKDKDKIYGEVLKSRYNDDLNRVELLLSLPVNEWTEELSNMDNGKDIGFSMSGSLPGDFCSICGQKSSKVSDYCHHLKYNLNQITENGDLVAAINDDMTFFDISGVKNPADRIAFGLLKAASENVIGGAQLAEMLNIPTPDLPETTKIVSTLRKLASYEREAEKSITIQDNPEVIGAKVEDMSKSAMTDLLGSGLNSDEILGGLGDIKVMISIKDFLKILMKDNFKEIEDKVPEAEERLPGVFSRMCVRPRVQLGAIKLNSSPFPFSLGPMLKGLMGSNGIGMGPRRKRVTLTIIKGTPGPIIKSASVEESDGVSETLAQLYGLYKIAMCQKFNGNEDLTFHSVLSHYIRS